MGPRDKQSRTGSKPEAAGRRNRPVSDTRNQDRQETRQQYRRQAQNLSSSEPIQNRLQHTLPADLQQSILDVFTLAFPVVSQQADFKRSIQEVKGHLYNRDFLSAFSKQEYLDAYALRWSAARALAYADIFTHPARSKWLRPLAKSAQQANADKEISITEQSDISESSTKEPLTNLTAGIATELDPGLLSCQHLEASLQPVLAQNVPITDAHMQTASNANAGVKVVCIGGGAGAEIVALAAARRCLRAAGDTPVPTLSTFSNMEVLAVDVADWSVPVRKLHTALYTPPILSSYASQAARDANQALLDSKADGQFLVTFEHQDILETSLDMLREMLRDVTLVTIMFTLNELFSSSLPKTTALLLNLTEAMMVDTYLVVVDSPGSYSEIQLGRSNQQEGKGATKKYPMKWLLDHTLLEIAGGDETTRWTKVEEQESKWFRIDEKLGLKYGVDLENCRYQVHVFQKLQ